LQSKNYSTCTNSYSSHSERERAWLLRSTIVLNQVAFIPTGRFYALKAIQKWIDLVPSPDKLSETPFCTLRKSTWGDKIRIGTLSWQPRDLCPDKSISTEYCSKIDLWKGCSRSPGTETPSAKEPTGMFAIVNHLPGRLISQGKLDETRIACEPIHDKR